MTLATRLSPRTDDPSSEPLPSSPTGSGQPGSTPQQPDRVVGHSALLSVSAGLVGVTSYVCTLVMANTLGPREFGQYATGQMLVGIVGIVASALVPLPLANALRDSGQGSERRKSAMAFAILVSIAAGVLAAVLAGAITAAFAPLPVVAAVAAAAASLFAISPTWGWMQGELRFLRYACCTVAEVVVRLLFSVTAVALGWGAAGALGGFVVGATVVSVVGLRAFRADVAWRPEVLGHRWRWAETGDIALTQLVVSTLVGADVVLVGVLGTASDAEAGFQALATLAKGPVYVAAGTVLVTFPLLRSRSVDVDAVLGPALRSFAHMAVPAAAVLATLPPGLALLVLPDDYLPAALLLPWLAVAGLGYAIITVLATVLLALRAYRRSRIGLAVAAAVLPSGLLLGWRTDGVAGLAVGGALGALAAAAALAVIIAPLLPTGTGRLAVRGVVAGGVLVAVLQSARVDPILWLAAVVIAAGVTLRSMQRGPARSGPSAVESVENSAPATLRVLHIGLADPRMPDASPTARQDHLINRQIAGRDAVTVLVPRFAGCTDGPFEGVHYVHIPAGRARRLVAMLLVGRRHRAELVVSSVTSGVRAATVLSRLPSIGVIRQGPADVANSSWLDRRVERATFRRHAMLIAPTDAVAANVRLAHPGRPVHVLPATVDRAALRITPRLGTHVVYCGPLDIRRGGVDLLLRAWALACPRLPGLLVLAGSGPDESALRALADDLAITDRVRFIRLINPGDRYGRLVGARVVAVPGRVADDRAVLDALATGTPVVAFDLPRRTPSGLPAGCGRYVRPFDVAAFSAALVHSYPDRRDVHTIAAATRAAAARASGAAAVAAAHRELYLMAARAPEAATEPIAACPAPTPVTATQPPARLSAAVALVAATPRWVLAAAVGAMAGAMRGTGLLTANDLFIDELTYSQIATQVASGQWPNQFGVPFFLHPPASFLLNATVVRALHLHGTDMDLVFDLRWVNAVLGSLTAVVLFLMVRRLTNTPVALLAAVVVAFDPFVLRNDSKVMLETPATVAVAAGWLVLLMTFSRPAGRTTSALEAGAGLLFGLGLATKDLTAIATLVPLVLALAWRRTVAGSTALRVVLAGAVPYVIFLGAVTLDGLMPAWWAAKHSGLRRVAGLDQETGFNSADAPAFLPRLLEQLSRFGTSYVLIGACVFAAAIASFSAHRARRFIGLVGLSTGAFGAFAVIAGAAEEQIGYYVAITAVLALAACCADLVDRWPAFRAPLLAAAFIFTALTVALGVHARLTPDDGYVQARSWLETNVPTSSPVGLTSVTGEFGLLPHPGYGVWPSLTSLAANDAQYVLTEGGPLSQGYGYSAPQLLDWLEVNAEPVFDHYGPSKGHVVIWRIKPGALADAVAAGVDFPPVKGGYP